MSNRSLVVMALALVLSACATSNAMAQSGRIRIPQRYRVIPQQPQRYAPQRLSPRYQPSPWVRPQPLPINVTTPNGINIFVNPVNGRGSVNFRGFRIGF